MLLMKCTTRASAADKMEPHTKES